MLKLNRDELSDLYDALEEAVEAVGYALELPDYDDDDKARMVAKQERWIVLRERVGAEVTRDA